MKRVTFWLAVLSTLLAGASHAQQHYFVDGYHGGIYGHYPPGYTQFMVRQLQEHPDWKIALEIEPETWDTVRLREPAAYEAFRKLFADQSAKGRIEYVNPAYGQAYMFNISGESMIRQLSYGMKKLETHFPGIRFDTYSSEEPCFTSGLPQVLLSFGFRYASLKNPNTCWGGYTRAFGGELVHWQGPDGSRILTVPRYATEGLVNNSTWQTTAWNNSPAYITSAKAAGITNPVGMCLQDAGWRNGPWLQQRANYVTWREYMGIANRKKATVWPLSQEDIQVSLVWGAQVLQRLAQQVRRAENNIVSAEKYAALQYLLEGTPWPQQALDTAWTALLLAQHHDCWIVPYNHVARKATWAEKVAQWTGLTDSVANSITAGTPKPFLRVVNTAAFPRNEWVPFVTRKPVRIKDANGQEVQTSRGACGTLWFRAAVPAMGFQTYHLEDAPAKQLSTATRYKVRTDLYELEVDPKRGGVITSLIVRERQLVDTRNARGFNELRGFDYERGMWCSSMDSTATVKVEEDGGRISLEIKGHFAQHPFTQRITLANGEPRIDMQVDIDSQGQPRIGAYSQETNYVAEERNKAFYNDSFKLQVLFPLQLEGQQVTKDAPFDVTKSRLSGTFFNRWDSIKNNIILHWIDITDAGSKAGMAIFSDHTTSYVHGQHYPPGLTLQYAGRALWGRDYKVEGATSVKYALVPHTGNWRMAGISNEEVRWCEPLKVIPAADAEAFSLLSLKQPGWQVTTMLIDGNDLLIRLYNTSAGKDQQLSFNGSMSAAMLEELDGKRQQPLNVTKRNGLSSIRFSAPPFGIRTLRLKNVKVKP
ncbi:glycosyl hydrolase [Chitinophaga horti]|uniref:Glycosyl hydrolase n=1 Tax=Chitinophaga horti TaxID=2920382 RepID=A0ABY6J830_9BACT|nr:glycoside hydrolase family 38 C-terminal domain-containing protein [Chitinophaga horti]UYQ94436.1 glycosyl hydrolase [Chitinophaga horti]